MKRFLISIIFVFGAIVLNAQDFFADEQNNDTIPKKFYEQKYHGTICYEMGIPNYKYGGCFLLHYNKEKFSPYFEFRMNPTSSIKYTMIKRSSNTNAGAPDTMTTSLRYRAYNISVGMATSPRKNVLIYANVGVRYQQNLSDKSPYIGYYRIDNGKELELIYGGGALYVFPFGLTAQLGVDFSKFTVITGLGFTL